MFITQVIPCDPPYIEEPVAGILDPATPVVSNHIDNPALAFTPDAPANPIYTGLPDALVGDPIRWFGDDFYFRIWPIPRVVDVQNPLLLTDIPFQLWSAFLVPNDLQTIVTTGAEGLTIDIDDTAVFGTLEIRTINVQITPEAPINIGALFTFDFEFGEASVSFIAILADILPIQPETAVIEKLEWKTNIIDAYDGGEVRIALRQRPRRTFTISLLLLNDADRKLIYDKLYQVLDRELIVPTVQYQSRLKRKTIIADNKLYTNPRRADLRAGEKVVVWTRDDLFYMFEVDEIFSDYVTITNAFSRELPVGSIVSNAFGTRLPNKSSLGMNAISGGSTLNALVVNSRERVAWPDNGVVVPTFQSRLLLLRRPLADGQAIEAFDIGLDVIDNDT